MDRNSITSIGVVAGAVYKSVIGVACYSFLVFSFFLFSFFMIITVREFLLLFKLRLSIWSNVMRNFLNLGFLVLVNPKGNRQHFDVTDQTRLELAVLVELGDSWSWLQTTACAWYSDFRVIWWSSFCNVKHCFFSMLNLGYREMSNCFLTHAVGCPQGDKLVD